jgi:hypothetical protein
MSQIALAGLCFSIGLLGCSAGGGASHSLVVGNEGSGGSPSGAGGAPSISVTPDSGASNVLSVHIESPPGLTVSFVTLRCSQRCADVLAVAKGGVGPYAFAWQDGSTSSERIVCPDASTRYSVKVTDSASPSGEFGTAPATATADLTANVIACRVDNDAGNADGGSSSDAGSPLPGCAPFRAIAAVASQPTPSTPVLSGYVSQNLFSVVVIAHADVSRSLNAACPHLFLAGDSAGTKPVAWDDDLLVESHGAPGAPVDSRVYYGGPPLTYNGQPVRQVVEPAGGFAPLTIDLTSNLPPGESRVDLALSILDQGFVGSTTDVWVVPR